MSMPPSPTVVMIAPNGQIGDVPVDRADEALKAGFKHGVEMSAPTGEHGVIPIDKAEAAQKSGFKLINGHLGQMDPSYLAMAASNSPSGADPHNPGNPNLNAVPESERQNVNNSAMNTAIATTPLEALTTPGLASKVSQARAAGKFAAGKVAEEGTLAGAGVKGAKDLIHLSADALEKFGASYPELSKLAKSIGPMGQGAGALYTAYEIFKKLHEK